MTSRSTVSAGIEYRPLRERHLLGLLESACLPLRAPRYATCHACEGVCPVKAIHVGETAIQLDESCVRCGRCAAACPMGALWLPGFSMPDVPQENAVSLCVDCWKVPGKLSPEGSVRVPCLGGLSPGRIVELVAMSGGRSLELLDRGWCSSCNAGGSAEHPVRVSLDQARSLLEAVGVGASRLPKLSSLDLPASIMPTDIPEPVAETGMSRRAFFSALTANALSAIDKVKPLVPEPDARPRRGFEMEPVTSRERERLLWGMERICKSADVPQRFRLFHRVEISDACNNHQLCASICPTGALGVYDQAGQAGLVFDTRLCIGCNECHSICPSGALSVLPDSYDALLDHPIHLTSFGKNTCSECGQIYAGKTGEGVCQQCQKRKHLVSSAFRSLFWPGR